MENNTSTTQEELIKGREELQKCFRNDSSGNLSKDWYKKNALLWEEQHETHNFIYDKACLRVLAEYVEDKEVSIVDIAAGTGIVGMMLKDAGYTGRIDGVDRSDAMLSIAKEKRNDIYDKFIFSDIGSRKIDEIEDGSYDHAICAGSVGRGQVEFPAIPTITRMLKDGGYFIFTMTTFHTQYEDFTIESLKNRCQQWEKDGVCHLVSCTDSLHTENQDGYMFVVRKGSNGVKIL